MILDLKNQTAWFDAAIAHVESAIGTGLSVSRHGTRGRKFLWSGGIKGTIDRMRSRLQDVQHQRAHFEIVLNRARTGVTFRVVEIPWMRGETKQLVHDKISVKIEQIDLAGDLNQGLVRRLGRFESIIHLLNNEGRTKKAKENDEASARLERAKTIADLLDAPTPNEHDNFSSLTAAYGDAAGVEVDDTKSTWTVKVPKDQEAEFATKAAALLKEFNLATFRQTVEDEEDDE